MSISFLRKKISFDKKKMTTISSCGISCGSNILAALACFVVAAPGAMLSLPPIAADDPIFGGNEPSMADRVFGTGRVTAWNFFVGFLIFAILYTLYSVLVLIFWQKCTN